MQCTSDSYQGRSDFPNISINVLKAWCLHAYHDNRQRIEGRPSHSCPLAGVCTVHLAGPRTGVSWFTLCSSSRTVSNWAWNSRLTSFSLAGKMSRKPCSKVWGACPFVLFVPG